MNYDTDSIELAVAAEHKAVATRDFQEKLREAITAHFGRPIALKVNIADATADTPAAQATRERASRQQEAVAAIQNDPFVQSVVRDLGGSVIPDSIKPL